MAFLSLSGLYHFTKRPWGCMGSSHLSMLDGHRILQPVATFALAYIDDLLIFSSTWEERLGLLRTVLQQLLVSGLTANQKKCHLGRTQLKYLGYIIGSGQLQAQPQKGQVLRQVTLPRDKKELQQFLGLAIYYRWFINQFASWAAPLIALLWKGQPWKLHWTSGAK